MIDIFFNKYNKKLSCKIIHLSNKLYSINYTNIIKKYSNKIDIILSVDKGYDHLKKYIKNINIYQIPGVKAVKKVPLGLTRILNLLYNKNFKELYISGVTFYYGKRIEDCYENNYIVNEGKKYNIFNKDRGMHNILSNILYTKMICNSNKNISMCEELKYILSKF